MTHHLPHLVMMLLPMVVFAGIFAVQWRLASDTRLPAVLWVMAGLTALSGCIHGGVTAHHAHEAALFGWAMAVMCIAQLTWAVWLLLSPRLRVVEVGVLGNLGIVVLWTWTRLVGVPFGIGGGLRQRMGFWDVSCTLLEVAAVLGGLVWLVSVPAKAAVLPALTPSRR